MEECHAATMIIQLLSAVRICPAGWLRCGTVRINIISACVAVGCVSIDLPFDRLGEVHSVMTGRCFSVA